MSIPRLGSVAELRTCLQQRRTQAIQSYREHLRPETLLVALRRIADELVLALLRLYPAPEGACIAAV
ncbi:MAG TPA: hypothetical protein VHK04_08440, partial [Castellaniella sp.]|nr:hypothetical protein [Castellaniella sp.]